MANGSVGLSGTNYDAFVSSQRTFNDTDWAAKIQEKYWRARQKFLEKIEKKEDACIVLSDSKIDSKLDIYHSMDKSCARLTNILENYQNSLYVFANEENALGTLLKECSKYDKTKAGKVMSVTSKSLIQSSRQIIKLYMPLSRMFQEMETFHSRAVEDTSETVDKLESKRSQYRASLLWMKNISDRLDPDIYEQLDKFRRVQNQVKKDKKSFDNVKMDVVQKIDLLMASRCNLLNQILASYQSVLLETFEKNLHNFKSVEDLIKKEDLYEYEFETLKQLNPLKISDTSPDPKCPESPTIEDLLQIDEDMNNNNNSNNNIDREAAERRKNTLIDLTLGDEDEDSDHQDAVEEVKDTLVDVTLDDKVEKNDHHKSVEKDSDTLIDLTLGNEDEKDDKQDDSEDMMRQLESLFGTMKEQANDPTKMSTII